jgi:diadenosine tetraphosphate (Ap4A) HIT family hydrolase
MPLIIENDHFTVEAHDTPHHTRENGGHIKITPKMIVEHRYDLPVEVANELAQLTMVVGEAFTNVMKEFGIRVARINYQDNGNWAYKVPKKSNQLHVHLYMRSWGEQHPDNDPRFQAFPEALFFPDRKTGYYDKFNILSENECQKIKDEIIRISNNEKYKGLNLF